MSNWIVLLTTCVKSFEKNNEDEINYRKELYEKQINRWLNETNLEIFLIENSDYSYDNIKHSRFHLMNIVFDKKFRSTSQYEARSMLYAINIMKETDLFKNCTHILKVTGRYFLENIEEKIKEKGDGFDLYVQHINNIETRSQNTEYYGIRKEYIEEMLNNVKDVGLMEQCFFHYTLNKKCTILGPFKNDVRRGGDGILYEHL